MLPRLAAPAPLGMPILRPRPRPMESENQGSEPCNLCLISFQQSLVQAKVWEYWPSGKNLGWEPGDLIQIPVLDYMVQINEMEWIVTMCYYKDVRILRWARCAYLQMVSSPLYSFPSRGRDILSSLSLFCLIFVFPVPAASQALNTQRTKWSSHSRLW